MKWQPKEAVIEQLHSAIAHQATGNFACAISLAACAEGMLPEPEAEYFRQKVKDFARALPTEEAGAKRSNDIIQWLKHGTVEGKKHDKATIERNECCGDTGNIKVRCYL
jgi:hypothetical protein